MKTFKLDIFTPSKHYFSGEVEFVSIVGEEFVYGILPGHASLMSKVKISKLKFIINGEEAIYAIGGGVMYIDENHNMKLLLDSIENKEEIDYQRALDAKSRAEKRIASEHQEDIDIARAKKALLRALNRIDIFNS